MLNRASPDRKSRRVTGILKALLTGPGLDQRAIHREVLVGKIRLGLLQHALEEFLRHLLVQQPIQAHREAAPPLPDSPVSRLGDLWLLGPHRALCVDATRPEAVARLLGERKPT
jgi:hypothetical protein